MGGSGVQGQPLLRKFEARLGYMKIMGKKLKKKMPPPTVKVYKNLPLKMDPKRLGCDSCLLFLPKYLFRYPEAKPHTPVCTPYSSMHTF